MSATPEIKPRRLWTPEEDRLVAKLYPGTPMPELIRLLGRTPSSIYGRAAFLGIKRSQAYLDSPHACRLRREDNPGINHRFQKGHESWNAGMKGWTAGGRSAETRFKKGSKPHTWVPIGTEQVRDGYLWRKITDYGGRNDWKQVHVMLWEHHHGPIPNGLILIFRDRNRQNIDIENLELIDRAENARRNSIHRYPRELKEVIRLQKKLERAIRSKHEKQND
jgi:hypothetical protein